MCHLPPEKWQTVHQSPEDDEMAAYVQEHCDTARFGLDQPFTQTELLSTISSLKNNKGVKQNAKNQ